MHNLHEVRQQKFQFQERAILCKWAQVSDRCTKEFFEFHEGPRRLITITELMDGDRAINTQPELEAHILNFYTQIYTRDDQVEENEDAQTNCLRFLQRTVTNAHNQELLRPITPDEVTTAVKQLPTGKSPGVDARPAEFYQALWDDIEFDVFNFTSESINQVHIDEKLNISKIVLLPKSKDRRKV